MVFSSVTFLFFFLPLTVAAYYLVPKRLRNFLLLVASLIFYLWGTGALVLVLLASIAANFLLGLYVERAVQSGRPRGAKAAIGLAVAINVGLLAWFKYASFAVDQWGHLLGFVGVQAEAPVLSILLPIGISFYTFHSLSYLIDIYRGVARHLRNPIDFGLYITFFPQLVAGPIVRFHEIRDQLVTRQETRDRFASGVYRFAHGLAKKVIVADTVAPVADAAFAAAPGDLNTVSALIGVIAYTVQLYFDFSGYSDMALGLAAMFGIQLPENFDRPYTSRSITEFWRRWHMSLSRWFRDYLYIPLGGNRSSRATTYRNLIIVFLATGIWHGANWTFLVWGAYHGTLLLIERVRGVGARSDLGWQSQAGTLTLVMLGWIIFRSPDIAHAVGYLAALVRPLGGIAPDILVTLNPLAVIGLALGIASFFLPRTWVTGRRIASDPSRRSEALRIGSVVVAVPVALILLVAGGFSPFLYFQF